MAQVVPEWRRPGEELYRASSVELAEALLRLLTVIAGPDGCVLVLEDLHWSDPDTAAVVECIGDNVAALPVLCVVTLRPNVAALAYGVVQAPESRGAGTVIELRRMGPAEIVEMAQLCLGTTTLPANVEELVRHFSDGLPFLVEELLASAVGAGFVTFGVDGWRTATEERFIVPTRFTDLVRRGWPISPTRRPGC